MPIFERYAELLAADEPVAMATVIEGERVGAKLLITADNADTLGSLGHPELDRVVARDARAELEAARSGVRNYGPEGQTTPEDLIDQPTIRVFVESHAPPPQMWIFGAVDFTAALAACGQGPWVPSNGMRCTRGIRHKTSLPNGRRSPCHVAHTNL